ncbi:MAG: hypothetical protein ACI9IP_003084 [Arcticibacterium sp.]|jgi:hypothetical protein
MGIKKSVEKSTDFRFLKLNHFRIGKYFIHFNP